VNPIYWSVVGRSLLVQLPLLLACLVGGVLALSRLRRRSCSAGWFAASGLLMIFGSEVGDSFSLSYAAVMRYSLDYWNGLAVIHHTLSGLGVLLVLVAALVGRKSAGASRDSSAEGEG